LGELGVDELEGEALEDVAGEDGGGLIVFFMEGGPASAEVVIVHGGEVIVDEGEAVDHLDGCGGDDGLGVLSGDGLGGEEGQRWAQALAGGQQGVLEGLMELGADGLLLEESVEVGLDLIS